MIWRTELLLFGVVSGMFCAVYVSVQYLIYDDFKMILAVKAVSVVPSS